MDDSQSFPQTHVSEIERAAGPPSAQQREALGRLLTAYRGPMEKYLRIRFRLELNRIDDILQGFALKFIEQNVLSRWSRPRGRFRTFLLTILHNWTIDHFRRRGPSGEGQDELVNDISHHPDHTDAFNAAWVQDVIRRALEATREHYAKSGSLLHWQIFEVAVVGPYLRGESHPTMAELASRFRQESPKQAHNKLTRAKEMFKSLLLETVGRGVLGAEEAELELNELIRIASRLSPDVIGFGFDDQAIHPSQEGSLEPTGIVDAASILSIGVTVEPAEAHSLEAQFENAMRGTLEVLARHADPVSAEEVELIPSPIDRGKTVRHLLYEEENPEVAAEWLKKLFRRRAMSQGESSAGKVAQVIYLLAIACILVRTGRKASKKENSELRGDLEKGIRAKFVDAPAKMLMRQAQVILEAGA